MDNTLAAIVTSYERPYELQVCLGSLNNQRKSCNRNDVQRLSIIVTDNSVYPYNYIVETIVEEIVSPNYLQSLQYEYVNTKTTDCYTAAEMVIDRVKEDFICFPSDDNWYAPEFAYRMLKLANEGCDFVYCDMLYDPRPQYGNVYTVMKCQPKRCHIDKGGFIIRTSLFKELGMFPGRPFTPKSEADGLLAEAVVASGAKIGYVPEVLFFHG